MLNPFLRKLALSTAIGLTLITALSGCTTTPANTVTSTNGNGSGGPTVQTDTAKASSSPGGVAGVEAQAYTISINGHGIASATPDIVDIQLGVETITGNAQQAINQNSTQMAAVITAVKTFNVDDKDIKTSLYNVWVEQVYNPGTNQPTGELRYHVVNLVTVRLRDVTKTGDLLQATAQAGANNINSISFGVADTAALERQARDQAVADAKAKAEQLATALGIKIGAVRQIAESTSSSIPYAMPAAANGMGGGGSVPVSSGSFNVSIDVQVTFDIQR